MLLAGALGALAGCSSEPEQLAVAGSAKAAKLSQCVAPTDFMRRNHMELIEHQRDETVHKGIRATDHSLAGCIDCHVQFDQQGQPVPVNAAKQFCAGCHKSVGESLTCFQCHSPVPKAPPSADSGVAFHHPERAAGGARALAMVTGEHDALREVQREIGSGK
jgi:hypothetical protein